MEVSGLTDKVKELLGMKSRVFTMSERRLFIRTVERYGKVEITLKDFQGYVEPDCQSVSTVAMASGFITIVCTTPRMVRRFLRMRDLGNVSYRIMTRAAAEPQPAEKERLSKEEMERFFGYAPMAPGGGEVTLGKDDGPVADLGGAFRGMMSAVFEHGGAELKVSLLGDERVQSFIDAHAQVLDSSFDEVKMSERMRQRLQRSDWVFSGMKAFREMGEAFPSLVDANGVRKPFEQFLRDVRKIDETYNKHYLRAEYEFAAASAEMAAKWERFVADGDRYHLQYRTVGDDRVRPEHAALNGVTLPPSDEFWESYYPPNGWRCRCTVVQVRKKKHPATPHDEAMALGEAALEKDTKGMFRFNPGKQERVFPAYNAYTQEKCRNCELGGKATLGKVELGKEYDYHKCQTCKYLISFYNKDSVRIERIKKIIIEGDSEPPHIEQYVAEYNGNVMVGPYQGDNEIEGNKALAKIISDKLGIKVYLLPRIDPRDKTLSPLRSVLHPPGVPKDKNPDFLIGGLLFDGKSLMNITTTNYKNAIEKRIKSAKEQADNIILEIPDRVPRSTIHNTINNYFKISHKKRIIFVIHRGELLCYKK